MSYNRDIDEGTINLSEYSVKDSCIWLLHKLNIYNFSHIAYSIPFCNYVMTWPMAVPLTAIIVGQSPYPNDIFPSIAAAMSYDQDLCRINEKIKGDIPPTVEILANDLYINANIDKTITIQLIRDGWILVKAGILLVNDAVFHDWRSPEGYKESEDQRKVLLRLLEETEKHGKRTVDIYAFGEAGQRMASSLCSSYKSNLITLSKKSATHPAAVSRRFSDFNDPNCHLGSPALSKHLGKCLSNQVALLHTMPKKEEIDSRVQRQADTYRNLSLTLTEYETSLRIQSKCAKELRDMDPADKERWIASFDTFIENQDRLAVRTSLVAALMSNMHNTAQGMSNNVAKSGPHISTVSPSPSVEIPSGSKDSPVTSSTVTIRKKGAKKSITNESSYDNISSAPSIKSITNTGSGVVSFRKSSRTTSALSTPSKNEQVQQDEPTTPTPSSTNLRKQNPIRGFKKLETSGPKDKGSYNLSKEQINQLSSVQAVVEIHKPDALEDEECKDYFETINTDISNKEKLNTIVHVLVECIDYDMKNIPNFDFAQWAVSNPTRSKTFETCKEYFNF